MQFRAATASDLAEVEAHTMSRGHGYARAPNMKDVVYALEHDGLLLGVGGLTFMNETNAFVWFDLTEASRDHHPLVFHLLKELLKEFTGEHGLKRIMAVVDVTFPEAIRTVEHFGFHRESVMPYWDGDGTAFMYVWLKAGELPSRPGTVYLGDSPKLHRELQDAIAKAKANGD